MLFVDGSRIVISVFCLVSCLLVWIVMIDWLLWCFVLVFVVLFLLIMNKGLLLFLCSGWC